MKIGWEDGVYMEVEGERIYLDPRVKKSRAIVSHGHTDHIKSPGIMTPETRKIASIRKRKVAESSTELPLNTKKYMDDFAIVLRNAGHVLGSAMVKINESLYTGDFDPQNGPTCEAAKPEQCENLIVEATYGSPNFVLPEREKVLTDFISWCEAVIRDRCVVIGAYALGKAQDIIRVMNESGLPVVVSQVIAKISGIYEESGISLDYYAVDDCPEDVMKKNHVFITSSGTLRWPLRGILADYWKRARFAFISGWCNFYDFTRTRPIHAQFPISNHADFEGIMKFVEECSPRTVYTVHGEAHALSHEIKKRLKIDAAPLR